MKPIQNVANPNYAGARPQKEHTLDDPTEAVRRQLAVVINESPRRRELLEAGFGRVWDTAELEAEFDVIGFRAPFIVVTRRSDGQLGSLLFQSFPRFYFAFVAD